MALKGHHGQGTRGIKSDFKVEHTVCNLWPDSKLLNPYEVTSLMGGNW